MGVGGQVENGMTEKQNLGDIVIEGTCEDWPGGSRTLKPCKPRPSNRPGVHWFGAEVDRDGTEVWFRITWEKIREMQEIEKIEQTPQGRGAHLVKALIASMGPGRLEPRDQLLQGRLGLGEQRRRYEDRTLRLRMS